ncbi:MAG: DUF4346 domain-containing protein [Dehalococcoidia bacterium]|nr:DUF4346 domain-containing protein [Dehalococcoidia bacterium]
MGKGRSVLDLCCGMGGASASAMTQALLAKGLVGDLAHALYVGRELQKAEVALRLHLPYEQDWDLELPGG